MKPTEYNFPTVVRHVYDIDAFEIIDRLMDKYKSNIDQVPEHLRDLGFIKLEEELLIEFLNEEGFDISSHQENRNFIVPSYYNLYNTYLGYKLLTIDLYKIEPLLSYQSVLFLGNNYAPKENFLGLIEFLVYDIVKARLLPFEQIRLEKIVNWLERNRVFMLNKAYNDGESTLQNNNEIKDNIELHNSEEETTTTVTEHQFRVVKMEPLFANVITEKLKCFFEGQEIHLFNFIIKNEFTEPLVFNGQANQLAELFKRLRYNSKISVATIDILTNWIVKHFATRNKQNEIMEFKPDTISQVLKKSKTEPKKGKRILEDVAEFIVPNLRKEDSYHKKNKKSIPFLYPNHLGY